MHAYFKALLRRLAEARRSAGVELAAAVAFWVLSLGRVIAAITRHETFGTEATLAAIAVFGLPMMMLGFKSSDRSRSSNHLPRR